MNSYSIKFKANETIEVRAADADHAQEVAIEAFEISGIEHSEIVSISRLDRDIKPGQFIGMSGEFACYYNVAL